MNRALPALAALALLCAAPVAATSFVMMTDRDLVDQTPLVVRARVLSADSAPIARPSTDYLIEVERVLKGDVPGSNLIVRVPGGIGPDGVGLRIWGAPAFGPDEEVVLFLRPGSDGTFRVSQLMLGAFHEARVGDVTLLVRNLAEADEVTMPGEAEPERAEFRLPRRRDAFIQWIEQRAAGIDAPAEYFHQETADGSSSPISMAEPFKVPCYNPDTEEQGEGPGGTCPNGLLPLRWFSFAGGVEAQWKLHQSGQAGLTMNQVTNALAQALAVWTNDGSTEIRYGLHSSPISTSTNGLDTHDDENVVLFEDPNGYIDAGPFSCTSGGVLAFGGPWFLTNPGTYNSKEFLRIVNGDVITNQGTGCFFQGSPDPQRLAAQLFVHELGHTLGFGHSCETPSECGANPTADAAIMRAYIHNTGYGPDLRPDDVAVARHHYGDGSTPGPGPGTPPAAPSQLAAQLQSGTSVLLTWNDNSDDETGFRVQQRTGTGAFVNLQVLPANTESMTVSGLAPATPYTWQVRALGANSNNSGFSNQVSLTTPAALPAAPSALVATPINETVILLDWQDDSVNETGFVIEAASPIEEFHEIGSAGANVTTFAVGGRVAGRPYTFRVRAQNGALVSEASNEASATTQSDPTAPCVADAEILCLLDDRFKVQVQWHDHINGGNGTGKVQPSPVGGSKTGVFSFFNANNIELIVKAIDGGPVNDHFWLFYGALSTVEYWVTVTDTVTGESNTYRNPPGQLCGVSDTDAFPKISSPPAPAVAPAVSRSVGAPLTALPAAGASGTCVPGANTLCLAEGRFEVAVDWTDQRTLDSGVGIAVPGSEKSGYFWFFNADNIELVVKILDATTINDNWWVFYGALSDVQYTIHVRDTVNGFSTSYVNEPGNFCGDADTESFPDQP